jgi:hypothetical protein
MNKVLFLCILFLAAIPLQDGLFRGEIIGAGPDIVSTLWGMWWFQQEGFGALFGKLSVLANYPNGVHGSVLSPSSAILWSLLEPLLGVGRALAVVVWMQIVLLAWSCTLLAKTMGVQDPWNWLAALVVICSRYLYFGVGEASVVAVVAVTIPWGLIALINIVRGKNVLLYQSILIAMIAVTALENPYLAPVLPSIVLLFSILYRQYRNTLLFSLFVGCFGLLSIAQVFGASANPDYPREVAGQFVYLFGEQWKVVDLPWARLSLEELVWPEEVLWTTNAKDATKATGGRYFGIVSLIIALLSISIRKSIPFVLLFTIGILLSLGSVQYGMAFPFLIFNALMDAVARPLTQPTRFLAVALIGFSVAVAIGGQVVSKKNKMLGWGCAVAILLEGIIWGGIGLRPPTTKLPTLSCAIANQGGVLIWPYDAKDGELSQSQLYQIQHGKPSVQTGIASWKLEGSRSFEKIRGAGFLPETKAWNERRLIDAGFDVVLVEKSQNVPVDLSRAVDCGDVMMVHLRK